MGDTAYWSIHYRLRRDRGPAKTHACADCGGRAATWAYKDPTGFSESLEDYRPLCHSCHKRQDQPRSYERQGPPPHGTEARYRTCHCAECREAHAAEARAYKARKVGQ